MRDTPTTRNFAAAPVDVDVIRVTTTTGRALLRPHAATLVRSPVPSSSKRLCLSLSRTLQLFHPLDYLKPSLWSPGRATHPQRWNI